MFNLRYLTSGRQLTAKQIDKLCWEVINGWHNFLTSFREHVNHDIFMYIILLYYL
jgi:hypothetical protein